MKLKKYLQFLFIGLINSLILTPLVSAQRAYDINIGQDLDIFVDLITWMVGLFNKPYVMLGVLLIAFWILLYSAILLAFRKVYKGDTSKEIKVISGSLALIMILSFFFVGGEDVLTRAQQLIGSFNGLAGVVLTVMVWVGLNALFKSWKMGDRWAKLWSTVIAFIMGMGLLSVGLGGLGNYAIQHFWTLLINLGLILLLTFLFISLGTKAASGSKLFGWASDTVRGAMGWEGEDRIDALGQSFGTINRRRNSARLIKELQNTFASGVNNFGHFVKLENKKNEFISHLEKWYFETDKYGKVVDFLSKRR